jgi:cell division protein FtsI (penicillin-binding protein 3)
MMIKVVEEGTGTRADVEGFSVAGKTGTAQIFDKETGKYSETEFIASFVGFIPAENPELAILVLIDRPKTDIYGGTVAASIFSETARDVMNYLGIFPEHKYKTKDEIEAQNDGKTTSPLL